MNRNRFYIGLILLGLMAVAVAAITVQSVRVQATASDGSGQFRLNLQATRVYFDDIGTRVLGRGSFQLTRGAERYNLQLRHLTNMGVGELENGGYSVMMEGYASFAPNFFLSRISRPEGGIFRLVIFDMPEGSEESDSVQFRFVSDRGRRIDFFGEVTGGSLTISEQTL